MNGNVTGEAAIHRAGSRWRAVYDALCDVLCGRGPHTRAAQWSLAVILLLLYLGGGLFWFRFLNGGALSYNTGDWEARLRVYYTVIHESLTSGQLPLFVSEVQAFGSHYQTNMFLSIVEVPTSPQFVLLRFLDLGNFAVVNTLFVYTLGFIGCWLIYRRFRLSIVSFSILVLVFNVNGHILAHINAGHGSWGGYFFLPYFVLWVTELVQDDRSYITALKLALVLLAINLQGGARIYVWCIAFLIVLGGAYWPVIKQAALAATLGTLLSAVRILPAAVEFWGYRLKFLVGFLTIPQFLRALVEGRALRILGLQTSTVVMRGQANWWEYDTFIGVLGLVFILGFGVAARVIPRLSDREVRFFPLDPPILALTAFSFGNIYRFIYASRIPILSSERVPSRFLIVPVLLLLVIGCIRFSEIVDSIRWKAIPLVLSPIGVFFLGKALLKYSRHWSMASTQGDYVAPSWYPIQIIGLASGPDRAAQVYLASLIAGLILSCLALVGIAVYWRLHLQRAAPSVEEG